MKARASPGPSYFGSPVRIFGRIAPHRIVPRVVQAVAGLDGASRPALLWSPPVIGRRPDRTAPSEEKEIQLVAFGGTALPDRRYESAIVVTILVLVGVRLICAAVTPLSFDEGLYWLWSRHIAGGYYDHPPVNPILIRLGTTLFGTTEFGVRVFNVLLALPASWAISI